MDTDPNDGVSLAALIPGGAAGFVWSDCGESCNDLSASSSSAMEARGYERSHQPNPVARGCREARH
jgi:hypothetical protein